MAGLYYDENTPPGVGQSGGRYAWVPDRFPALGLVTVTFSVENYDPDLVGTWNSWLQIDSMDDLDESDESNNLFGPFQITWQELPVITDLTISKDPSLPGNIKLNWTYPLSVSSFLIYRSANPYATTFSPIACTPATSFCQATEGMYFYQVTARRLPADKGAKPGLENTEEKRVRARQNREKK